MNLLLSGRKRRRTFELFGVFAAYVLAGKIGLSVPFTSGNVSPLWPPAGVALAAMLIFGYRIWPAVALGAFIVNFFTKIPHVAAAGIAVGNTVGPLCGTWSLRQLPRFQSSLTRLRDVLGIGILGAFCGTAVSATVGTGSLFLTGVNAWSGFPSAWLMWWLGDAMGVLIITPLVLTFTGLMSIRQGRQLVELACLLLGAVGSALVMFDPRLGLMRAEVFAFGVFPFVLWGALRFEAAGAAVVSFLISVIAVLGTAHGFVPLIKGNPLQNAILLQSFLGVISVSGMVMAAVVAERAQLIREQSAQEALDLRNKISLLSRAVEQTAESVMITDRQGTIQYVNPAFEATTGYGPEEAIGKTPRILKSNLHKKEFYSRLWNQILEGGTFRETLVNCKKSGQLFWAEQTITPIKDSAGAITHFVSVLQDLTEFRKQQEQELQLRLARDVQQRFYTGAAICGAGFDIASAAYPALETGGDYLDLFSMADGRICIGIGDVSGHGLDSALVMTLTRAYVRSFAQVETDLAKILSSVNRMLIADHLDNDRFVTLLLVYLDGPNGFLSYASAGHISGFLMNVSGKIESVLESSGPPLGLFDDPHFVSSALPLAPQQLVILLTDGAAETTSSKDVPFGTDGVLEYVRDHRHDSARDLAEGIYRAARAFAGDEPQRDDVTDVIIKIA